MNNQIICYKVTSPWVCSSLIGDPVFSALVSTEPLWDYELWQVWGPHMQYWQKIVTFNRNLVQWMDCFSNSSSACRLLFVLLLFLLYLPFLSPFRSLCFVWGCNFFLFVCLSSYLHLLLSLSFLLSLAFSCPLLSEQVVSWFSQCWLKVASLFEVYSASCVWLLIRVSQEG